MKRRFFRDTHELDSAFAPAAPDKVSVCLRLGKRAYEAALARSCERGVTSGEYMETLILREEEKASEGSA